MKKRTLCRGKIGIVVVSLLILCGLGLFIPFPPGWNAYLAASQPDYFFQDEEQWLKKHSLLEIISAKIIEFKLRNDIIRELEDRLQLEAKSDVESIQLAANEVRNTYITQLQEEVPVISNSSALSFVRGFGFCDQINAGLALLLHDKLEKVQLYGITNPSNQSRHTLIRSQSSLGTVWIDAFTCVNAFGFPEELSEEGKKLIPFFDNKASLLFEKDAYLNAIFFNEFTINYTCTKGWSRMKALLVHKSYDSTQVIVMEKPDSLLAINRGKQGKLMDALKMEPLLAKEAYLQARIYQLYGQNEKALEFYSAAKARSISGLISQYASVFLKRLQGDQILCQK